MSYVPVALRRTLCHPRTRKPVSGGFYALPVHDQHELRSGVEHVTRLGERAWCELLIEIVQDECDFDEVLVRLRKWRTGLTPEMVQTTGADRLPPRLLRAVPTL